jgi:hemoglobin-like flavoprotein
MAQHDLILDSLELTAEKVGDITLPVCDRFFSKCPESQELMQYIDPGVQGRMIQEVMRLIMVDDSHSEGSYLEFEVKTHIAYGVHSEMYANLLLAVQETVEAALGDLWNEDFRTAWKNRLRSLTDEIALHLP